MSAENKAVVRRIYDEFINQGRVEVFEELISPDFVEHEEMPDVPPTAEGVKEFFALFRSAFPDLHGTLDDLIAEGDKVVALAHWSATHRGEFMGVPASGKSVTFGVIDAFRIVDGRIVDHWGQSDNLGLMQQIGGIPS